MQSLQEFTNRATLDYQNKVKNLQLFQPEFAQNLTLEQKQKLILTFYHIRGHFYKFLWFMGSTAPNKEYKKVIMGNITEEFGSVKSHEQWFFEFAKEFGVDCNSEILHETHNHDWVKEYNNGHIEYILSNNWDKTWSLFSMYEMLDNTDYSNLYYLASNIGSTKKGLVFFEIHRNASHYDNCNDLLQKVWDKNPDDVVEACNFVLDYQCKMWERLGECVESKK
jgi:Iron-containing redox enzyme